MVGMTEETVCGVGEKRVGTVSAANPGARRRIEENVVKRTVGALKGLFGEKLKKVILFGSYARGDFDDESDVDIMALLDMEREKIKGYRPQVIRISSDIGIDNDIYVSIKLNSAEFFRRKSGVSGYYRNVIKDGKVFYDG